MGRVPYSSLGTCSCGPPPPGQQSEPCPAALLPSVSFPALPKMRSLAAVPATVPLPVTSLVTVIPEQTAGFSLSGVIVALMRPACGRDGAGSADRLEAGGIVLDLASHRIVAPDGEVSLTPREFDLSRLLMAEDGRVVSRQRILDTVWGPGFVGDDNVLDVHMSPPALRYSSACGQSRRLERFP